jgi:hypothetical protein
MVEELQDVSSQSELIIEGDASYKQKISESIELSKNVVSTCENQQRKDKMMIQKESSQSMIQTALKSYESTKSSQSIIDLHILSAISYLTIFYAIIFVAIKNFGVKNCEESIIFNTNDDEESIECKGRQFGKK